MYDHLILAVVTILALYGMVVAFALSLGKASKHADEWAEEHMAQVPDLKDRRKN